MFSGLQQGAALYVLDKSQEPKVVTGYVERVSPIHPMYPNYNPNASFGQNLQMAVDIVLKIGNDKKEFVGTFATYNDCRIIVYATEASKKVKMVEVVFESVKDDEYDRDKPGTVGNILVADDYSAFFNVINEGVSLNDFCAESNEPTLSLYEVMSNAEESIQQNLKKIDKNEIAKRKQK